MLATARRSAHLKHRAPLPSDSAGAATPAVRASSEPARATSARCAPAPVALSKPLKEQRRRLHGGAAPSPQAAHVAAVHSSAEQVECHARLVDRRPPNDQSYVSTSHQTRTAMT